jgi:hypothetical protein
MNERIRQLAEQATICYSNGQERTFDKQKFAELIVQECADYFGREGDHRFEVDGNWIAKTIKQHFGVGE